MNEIIEAKKAWDAAPLHVKMIAGAYVLPILAAISALSDQVEKLKEKIECTPKL